MLQYVSLLFDLAIATLMAACVQLGTRWWDINAKDSIHPPLSIGQTQYCHDYATGSGRKACLPCVQVLSCSSST